MHKQDQTPEKLGFSSRLIQLFKLQLFQVRYFLLQSPPVSKEICFVSKETCISSDVLPPTVPIVCVHAHNLSICIFESRLLLQSPHAGGASAKETCIM